MDFAVMSHFVFVRYANSESYEKSLEDFQEALNLNPQHKNARKYICETLVAQAKT